jgi:hypothetical protein
MTKAVDQIEGDDEGVGELHFVKVHLGRYPYSRDQILRARRACFNNDRLTLAYLDLAAELGREDPNEPNPRAPIRKPESLDLFQ